MTDKTAGVAMNKVLPVRVWADKDQNGKARIWRQYEGGEPFLYVEIHYDYRHTSNVEQLTLARHIVEMLGGGEKRDPAQITFDDWCAAAGGYLNDSDDAAKAARLMARRAWDAAVAAKCERCAAICDALARVGDSRDAAACAAAIRGNAKLTG